MASKQPLHFPVWLQYVVRHRLAFVSGSIAAAVLGISVVAAVFRRRSVLYSRTAEIACLMRALSLHESDPRYRTRDFLAEYFLPWHYRLLLKIVPSYVKRKANQTVPAGLSWVIARTHIFDHLMESTLLAERDITQVVILGAGFDTRFYRLLFPNDREIHFFELDEAYTQSRKRGVLHSIPEYAYKNGKDRVKVNYVPINFEHESIETVLTRHRHYNKHAKTFFLWEAVSVYLNESAITEVLEFVKRCSGPGSLLAFDIRYQEAITAKKKYKMSPLASTVGKLREPYKFGIPEGSSRAWIQSAGFDVHALYGPSELAEYVTSDVSYSLDCPDIMDIIVARTPMR